MFQFNNKFLDEKEVVEIITSFIDPYNQKPDLSLFNNLLFDPVGYEGIEQYEGYYMATNIDRKEFDFERQGNGIIPGDFDIIFIPYNLENIFFERTAVFEVKIARPHAQKLNKPSKSLGSEQIKGLLEDGFPLVGLLHVCMPAPLPPPYISNIKLCKYPVGDGVKIPSGRLTEEDFEPVKYDWLPMFAAEKQMQRMISTNLPKYVGMNAFSLTKDDRGKFVRVIIGKYDGFVSGYFNPSVNKQKAINCVKAHFEKYGLTKWKQLQVYERKIF